MSNSELTETVSRKISNIFFKDVIMSDEVTVGYSKNVLSLAAFHRNILQKCFHRSDLDPLFRFISCVVSGEYIVILAKKGDEILGGIVLEHSWSVGKKIIMINWIAVHEAHRGHDVGSLLIEEAKRYAIANGALVLLGEVENPDFFDEESSAMGNPAKRVKFYSRFGCQRLEVPYFIPARWEDQEPIFGVMLSLFPLSEEQESATELVLPELVVFMEELLDDDSDDAWALLEACKGTVKLVPYRDLL